MLSKYQFEVLRSLIVSSDKTQREIASEAGVSLGSVNKARKSLKDLGFLDGEGRVTPLGESALSSYRVDNAVILAAGSASRLAPLSFEKPKAMFEVRGEVLIERLIRQLREAGIDDITVVVGYMKESFFYLEEDFAVKILVAPEYSTRNNHASLYAARNILGNTYICNSDEYYTENIFSRYMYRPCLSACSDDADEDEYALALDAARRIVGIERGGEGFFLADPRISIEISPRSSFRSSLTNTTIRRRRINFGMIFWLTTFVNLRYSRAFIGLASCTNSTV